MMLPLEGNVIRFAPGRNDEPLTALWTVRAQGNEVYAATKSSGPMHISVHQSGQVHCRLETKAKQDFAPIMPLGGGWSHALEIRFLRTAEALSPRRPAKSKKGYFLFEMPDGFVFLVNLIIGDSGLPLNCSLPILFAPTVQVLWRTRLQDGRIAALVGRLIPLDQKNREFLRYHHEELKTSVILPSNRENKYFEMLDMQYSSERGNIIVVLPLGEKAIRFEDETRNTHRPSLGLRRFLYRSSRSAVDLIAPDGNKVAVVEAAPLVAQIDLVKGVPKFVEIGAFIMQIEPEKLIAGSPIKALAPRRLLSVPSVGEGSPGSWGYMIRSRFDGYRLTAVVHRHSAALLNKNFARPVSGLGDDEEIVIAAPAETLELTATLDRPSTSAKLCGQFTLRDRR